MTQEPCFADCLHEIVACFDKGLRHTYANHRVQQSTGLRTQSFIGKTNQEIGFAPELANHWDERVQSVFATGRITDLLFEFSGPRGTIRFSTRLKPELDATGKVVSVVAIARGFQEERHLATLALDPDVEASHFRAIVQSSDDAIISKTLDGIVTSWNRGACDIFGYSSHEMVGQPLRKLFPQDRVTEEDLILERIREGERVDHFETVRVRKDGTRIDVSVTISPIFDRIGNVVGASKIARDITQKKTNDARLKLISNVFTHTGEAVVIADARGQVLEVNRAFTLITGYSREETLGQDFRFLRSARQGPEVVDKLLTELLTYGHCQGEVWSRRKDGVAFAGLLTVSAVHDSEGCLHSYVALFADITPVRLQQERLEHVAHFDALTDLPNRLLLSDRLHQAMAYAQRQQQTLAVLYMDLDGFKQINDTFGHSVGDELLVAISARMKSVLREVDTLARFGGDEFVAVLTNVQGLGECAVLVERILKACAEPISVNGQVVQVSTSIGLTLYPQDDSNADQLLRHADRAMYEAKQSGKNRYFVFDAAHDAEMRSQGEQLSRLQVAVERSEFVLHYQPKVNLKTGEVMGAEALIRWQHPQRGLLAPAAFLPLSEHHVLSEQIGSWVLNEALQQMSAWLQQGLRLCVSINVASRQIQHPGFAKELASALAHYPQIDAADLELEILETNALEDIGAVSVVMHDCHRLGVRFAIDDFGTGYSSLTYLKRLPAETLKIDQSFVRDMLTDREDMAIVQNVIGLAESFHRVVIAEGVETLAHGEQLLKMGCLYGQGYGIAKPMPAQDFPEWIQRWQARLN